VFTVTVNDDAVGPHLSRRGARDDHERLVLEARDVGFDWAKLPFHYVPGEPFTTHMLNVLHLLLPAGEEFFVDVFKKTLPLVDGVPFQLELARSRRVLDVPANPSALDVMLDDDPTTAYSCRQGFCGTCKVNVLSGQINRSGRTAEADGEMLVCVSRANRGRVVIDA
jgi:ferredoxin